MTLDLVLIVLRLGIPVSDVWFESSQRVGVLDELRYSLGQSVAVV